MVEQQRFLWTRGWLSPLSQLLLCFDNLSDHFFISFVDLLSSFHFTSSSYILANYTSIILYINKNVWVYDGIGRDKDRSFAIVSVCGSFRSSQAAKPKLRLSLCALVCYPSCLLPHCFICCYLTYYDIMQ
jgi:hypothetical protein